MQTPSDKVSLAYLFLKITKAGFRLEEEGALVSNSLNFITSFSGNVVA